MEIHTESTVSSFLSLIERTKSSEVLKGNKADFLFRGQNTDEPLIPKIARLKPKGTDLNKIEQLMLADYDRQSLPFREFNTVDQWDLLALAQHHGLPTRLLDWSYSALAALWFCVKRSPKKDKKGSLQDGIVWLFKTFPADFIEFPTDETPFGNSKTRIFRPRVVARRILAQSGVFTCHKRMKDGRFIPFDKNKAYSKRLVKITIPASAFGDIRQQLEACGVHRLTLFPDLDGLAAYLQHRYFHESEL